MKTLEGLFWGISGASNSLTVSEAKQCVKEWLQQKQTVKLYECNCKSCSTCEEGWQEGLRTLLKELEQ